MDINLNEEPSNKKYLSIYVSTTVLMDKFSLEGLEVRKSWLRMFLWEWIQCDILSKSKPKKDEKNFSAFLLTETVR